MVEMLMCSGGQWWICSGAVVVNGGFAHVEWWSKIDMFMCSSGQGWICSCVVVVIGGYVHV